MQLPLSLMFSDLFLWYFSANIYFKTYSGKSFISSKIFSISINSVFNKSSVEQIKGALWTNDFKLPCFYLWRQKKL